MCLSVEAKALRLVKRRRYAQAARLLAAQLDVHGRGPATSRNLIAVCKAKLGELHEARNILQQLQHEKPGDPRVLNNLGNLALLEDDARTALKLYREATRLSPWAAEPRFNMCLAYRELGEIEKALYSYHQFVLAKRINFLGKALAVLGGLAASAALIRAWLLHP